MNIFQKTSHAIVWLVFLFLLTACKENKKEQGRAEILYQDGNAHAMVIPRDMLKGSSEDSIRGSLRIYLRGQTVPILGEIKMNEEDIVFEPIVFFTPGLTYEIKFNSELLTLLTIREVETFSLADVTAIYPSADTVPENLLKIYIQFAQSMQEGVALENIVMIKNGKDTIDNIFLDLQPELWNMERNMLTLWLDPGRIKRDLQPHQQMGIPLRQGDHYELVIKKEWRNIEGKELTAGANKDFVVGPRDSIKPDYMQWNILAPRQGTNDPLEIVLDESLDQLLLENTITIRDKTNQPLNGSIRTGKNETLLLFTPLVKWKTGDYVLEIEARLEDLAGNNLNRLFDRDITKKDDVESKQIYRRPFSIK
jgi:hypothetical protein